MAKETATKETTIGHKLFHLRCDGSIGPLFINRRQRIPLETWLEAEDHPTKGYTHRPGWHVMLSPFAPHLSPRSRKWFKVEVRDYTQYVRPASQGGLWILAQQMRVIPPAHTL